MAAGLSVVARPTDSPTAQQSWALIQVVLFIWLTLAGTATAVNVPVHGELDAAAVADGTVVETDTRAKPPAVTTVRTAVIAAAPRTGRRWDTANGL